MLIDSGAAVEGVSRGAAITIITYIVVAIIGKVVCPTVVADVDGDLPGCRPVSM